MNRSLSIGLLILGVLICFGTAAVIINFLVWPELRASEVFAGGNVSWNNVGPPLGFAFIWVIGGLIAIYLLIRSLTTYTGHPESDNKPWLAVRKWASPKISSEVSFSFLGTWLLSIVSLLLTVGLYFLARDVIAGGDYSPLMYMAPFALAGLGMLIYAINITREWLRFGQMVLTLDPYPGSIGGHIGGQVDIRLPYNAKDRVQVHLICQRMVTTGRRKKNQRTDVVWRVRGLANTTPGSKGTRLGFRFEVPGDLPPSALESFDYHQWKVVLSARLPGADLDREFIIPVFPTAESSSGIRFDSTKHSGQEEFSRAEALSILKLSRDMDGGVVLKYPIFHREKAKGGAILLAVGLGCTLPGIAILMDEVNVVGIGFLIIGMLFAPGGFYLLFHNLTVKMNVVRLQATLKLFGIPIRRREAARNDVEYLRGWGQYIQAIVKEGKAITISQSFADDKAAGQALKAIAQWTGYPVKSKKKRRRQPRADAAPE